MPLSLILFEVDELRAATDGFAASSFISAGGCGTLGVFRGTLASGEIVAVKRLAVGTDAQHSLNALMNELYTLGRIVHQNLLPVLGFVCQSPELMLVMPYMARGSLHDALHGGNNTAGAAAALAADSLDAAWRLSFLLGLTRGIQALHGANFVHRDIKSANVLIGDDGRAVLADTGIARRMRAGADATAAAEGTRCIGTDGYVDPEYQRTWELTYKSDVFSLGVVILEMLTGRPAAGARPPLLWERFRSVRADDWNERVGRVVAEAAACWGGGSPTAGPVVALASIALRATSEASASRPSIDEVISTLEEIPVDGVRGGDGVDEDHVRMCMVCLCEPRALRFNCGHMTTCGDCVARWPDCLLCNDFTGFHLNLEANPRDQTYQRPAPQGRSTDLNIVPEPVTGPAPGNGGAGAGGGGDGPAPRECVVCLSAVRAVRLDCGHMLTCNACTGVLLAEAAPRCPQCRAPASVAVRLMADPMDPTYLLAPPATVQPGVVAGGSRSSFMSDEDILRVMRERCPALQELWPAEGDASSWAGVTFRNAGGNGARRVVKVDLERKLGDAVEVLAELGALTALTELVLYGNQLTSLPAELGALTALRVLNLSGNQLTSLPAELGALTALTKLFLQDNQLTSLPGELGALTALTFLRLDGNQLTSLPAELGALTALTFLRLDYNQLTSLPAELGALTALTQLYLHWNRLTSLPAELGALTALTALYLEGNQLTSLPAEWDAFAALERSGCSICR
jgi:serine/threonine protein kinase